MISYYYFLSYRVRKKLLYKPRNITCELIDAIMGYRKWRPNVFRFWQKYIESNSLTFFIKDFIPEWQNYMVSWNVNNVTLVSYENLKHDTKGILHRIIKELGFQPNPYKIDNAICKWSVANYKKYFEDDKNPLKERDVRTGSIGEWRSVLSEEQKKIFKKIAGDSIINFGFEEDNNW